MYKRLFHYFLLSMLWYAMPSEAQESYSCNLGNFFVKDHKVYVYNVEDNRMLDYSTLDLPSEFSIESIFPWVDGKVLLVDRKHGVVIYDLAAQKLEDYPVAMEDNGLLFVDDGYRIWRSGSDKVLQCYDSDGRLLGEFDAKFLPKASDRSKSKPSSPWYLSWWFILIVFSLTFYHLHLFISVSNKKAEKRLLYEKKLAEKYKIQAEGPSVPRPYIQQEHLPAKEMPQSRHHLVNEALEQPEDDEEELEEPAEEAPIAGSWKSDVYNQAQPKKTNLTPAEEKFLEEFKELVGQHISNPELDNQFLTEAMNMNRNTLANRVRKLTGLNLQAYVTKRRMELVIQLMQTTDLSMAEIAEQAGFSTSRYFSTSFKNYTGKSPLQYRRELRTNDKPSNKRKQ